MAWYLVKHKDRFTFTFTVTDVPEYKLVRPQKIRKTSN